MEITAMLGQPISHHTILETLGAQCSPSPTFWQTHDLPNPCLPRGRTPVRLVGKRKELNMSVTRYISAIGLILTLLLWTGTSTARQCDQCSKPRIAFYDARMLVPRPSTADSIVKWWTLEYPMHLLRQAITDRSAPTRECISAHDGAMVNARDLQGDVLRFGVEYFNVPPPTGEVRSEEYLLSGFITSSGGIYTLNAVLETAISREVAITKSVTYGFDQASQESAAQTLIAAFTPIFYKIRDYEVKKRNADVTVAISSLGHPSPAIAVTPRRTKIDVGDSVDVDIAMIDCDDVPLGNREIFFTDQIIGDVPCKGTTGGTVVPPSVITDASGKAKVKFIAGKATGIGNIVPTYQHKKPCGTPSALQGNAAIIIGRPLPSLWLVHAALREEVDRRIDTTWTSGSATGSETLTEISEGTAFINALIKNGGKDTTSFYFVGYEETGDTFDNATVSGTWHQQYFYRSYVEAGGGIPPKVDIVGKSYFGTVVLGSGYTGFEFHYPNNPNAVAIVAQCAGTAEGSSQSKYTVNTPQYHWEESSNNNPTGSSVYTEFNANECSIAKSASSYSITGSRTRVVRSGPQKTTRTISLNATISLYDSPTGLEQSNKNDPTAFNLEQNYPNPFNPSTTIVYRLSTTCSVILKVYDVLGREVATLVNRRQNAGIHNAAFDGTNIPSGVYFYRIDAVGDGTREFTSIKKLVVLK
jgi:hypothetical protein